MRLACPKAACRTTHTLFIVGLFCASLLVTTRQIQPVPPYLVYLLFMVLGHYFAHRGNPAAGPTRHPLFLPRGSVRFLVMVALIGTVSWCFYNDPEKLREQFELSLDALKQEPFLPVVIMGAFFLGVLVRAVVGREDPPYFLQDLEAWLSLISVLGLLVAALLHLVIGPSMESKISLPTWEAILAGIVAFYFGERS